MIKRTPKQTVEHLLKTWAQPSRADLGQLLVAVDDATRILAELEQAHATIATLAQLLTPKQKQDIIQQHVEQGLLNGTSGIMRHCAREAVIERSRRIHGEAK